MIYFNKSNSNGENKLQIDPYWKQALIAVVDKRIK